MLCCHACTIIKPEIIFFGWFIIDNNQIIIQYSQVKILESNGRGSTLHINSLLSFFYSSISCEFAHFYYICLCQFCWFFVLIFLVYSCWVIFITRFPSYYAQLILHLNFMVQTMLDVLRVAYILKTSNICLYCMYRYSSLGYSFQVIWFFIFIFCFYLKLLID